MQTFRKVATCAARLKPYFASNFCHICMQAFRKLANGPLWFGLPITSISNSEVVLNVNAASLELVVNASPGKIMFGQVSSMLVLRMKFCGQVHA